MVEHLPGKCKALNSNSSTSKKRNEQKRLNRDYRKIK
jgi:hypothetical protein